MKNARFLFTAVLLTIFISNTFAQIGTSCNDGDTKKDDEGCNDCFCSNGLWACTLKLCGDTHIQLKREAPECSAGETKQIACNHCKCIQGRWACSRKACLTKREINECEQGETKQQDCNQCFCSNGRWICTLRGCLKKKREINLSEKQFRATEWKATNTWLNEK
ncbi:uncharacterized protein [Onthophagus taurus]|uniref:uncharacterized protein isoform X2 n=1 Tax=Onthophagus taurus TaxID=166361 RepID=UPI0039BE58AC